MTCLYYHGHPTSVCLRPRMRTHANDESVRSAFCRRHWLWWLARWRYSYGAARNEEEKFLATV